MAAGGLLGALGCALLGATVEMARAPELIAFVPEQRALAMTPERQQQMEAMLARESAESRMVLPPGYRAEPAKAVLPPAHGGSAANSARHSARKAEASSAVKTSSHILQQSAKAERTGDRLNASTEQQWIVLSAWEEVRTVSRTDGSGQVADYATSTGTQGDESALNATAQGNTKGRSQSKSTYTVTQLILRVVPANPASNSTQPQGMLHGGWFVIQL